MKEDFRAGVGLSRKWDAREAGREVAETALEKLDGEKPKFFLLFSTIHYEKYGGFQELLNGVWEVLPEGTPLIGGTVAGFMNNYGCFARGVTALTVSYPNMDVAVGVGENTKRNPSKAGNDCAKMIKDKIATSSYHRKFLLSLISATEILELPGVGRKSVIRSKAMARTIISSFKLSQNVLQKGAGMEEFVLENVIKELPDFHLLHASTCDDKFLTNYQFFNERVLKNSIVALGLTTDLNFDVNFAHGLKESDVKFRITDVSPDGRIIYKINGKPAASTLLELIGYSEDFFDEKLFVKRFPYFPFGIKKGEYILPRSFAMILGESIPLMAKIETGEACILLASGEKLIEAAKELVGHFDEITPLFGIIVSCAIRLMTLGNGVHAVRNILLDLYKDRPFLTVYSGGEGVYCPQKGFFYLQESIDMATFWR